MTNVEYLAARRKGIPIYAFVEPGLVALLPLWKANPAADFSKEVDSPKLFEFLERVRSIDNVWMQEFRNGGELIEALRIQFSYQQYRGLQVQQRLRSVGDLDWSRRLRGEALRLALEQPPNWEFLLFGAALNDCVRTHHGLARRHKLGLRFGMGEDVAEPLEWIQARFQDGRRFADTLSRIFNSVVQEGIGPDGQAGNPEILTFAAEAAGDVYRDALQWANRVRTANVDERFRGLLSIVGDMLNDIIDQVEAYGPRIAREVEEALALPTSEEPRVIAVTLTITLRDETLAAFTQEVDRLQAGDY